jgi:hypothetical protein
MNRLLFALLLLFSQTGATDAAGEERRHRDPFLALPSAAAEELERTAAEQPPIQRPPGLKGLRITETSLVGIVSSGESYLAILAAEHQFIYIARVGSRLFDGSVLLISDKGILFSQDTDTSDRSQTVFKPFRWEATQ